jgi:hypothetical protein
MIRSCSNKHRRFTDEEEEDEELLLSQQASPSNRSSSSDWVVEKPLAVLTEKMTQGGDYTVSCPLSKMETGVVIEPFSSRDDIEQTLLIFNEESGPRCHNHNNDQFKNEGSFEEQPSSATHISGSCGNNYSLLKAGEAEVVVQQADVEGHVREHLHLDVDKMAAQVHQELMQRAELRMEENASTNGSPAENDVKPTTRKRRMVCYVLPVVLVALAVAIVVVIVVVVLVPKGKSTNAIVYTSGKCSLCANGTIPLHLDTNRIDEMQTCLSFMDSQVTLDATNPQCQQGQALAWMFCDCPTLPSSPYPYNSDTFACDYCPDGVLPVGQADFCDNLNIAVTLVGSSPFMTCDDVIAVAVGRVVVSSNNCTCPNLDPVERFSRLLRPISGAIRDSTSPQFQALHWIANVDPAKLSVEQQEHSHEMIRQRYVAAVLYFSLGGESWINQHNFLSADHACLWNDNNNDDDDDDNGIGCNELDDGVTWFRLRKCRQKWLSQRLSRR